MRIQSRFRGYVVRKAYKLYRLGGAISEILYSPALAGVVPPKDVVRPYGRINAMMAVQASGHPLFFGALPTSAHI